MRVGVGGGARGGEGVRGRGAGFGRRGAARGPLPLLVSVSDALVVAVARGGRRATATGRGGRRRRRCVPGLRLLAGRSVTSVTFGRSAGRASYRFAGTGVVAGAGAIGRRRARGTSIGGRWRRGRFGGFGLALGSEPCAEFVLAGDEGLFAVLGILGGRRLMGDALGRVAVLLGAGRRRGTGAGNSPRSFVRMLSWVVVLA